MVCYSKCAIQQEELYGLTLFYIAANYLLSSLTAEFKLWYWDSSILEDSLDLILQDLRGPRFLKGTET